MVRQSEKGGSLEAALATAGLAGLAAYAQDAVRHGRPSRARSASPRRGARRASPFGRRRPFRGGMDMATLEGFAAEAAKAKTDDVPVDDGQDGGRRRRKPSARKKHGGMDFAMLEGFQAAAAEEAKKAPASPTADQDGGRRRPRGKKHGGMDFAMLEGFAAEASKAKADDVPVDSQDGGRRRRKPQARKKHGGMDFAMLEGFEAEAAKAKTDDLPVDDGVDSLQDGGRRRRKSPARKKHGGMDFAMLEGFQAAAAEEAKKPQDGGRRKGARKGGYTSLEQLFATFGGFNDEELAGGKKKGKGRKGARRGGGERDQVVSVNNAAAEGSTGEVAEPQAPLTKCKLVLNEDGTASAVEVSVEGGRRKRVVRRRGGELVSLDGGKKSQKKKSR